MSQCGVCSSTPAKLCGGCSQAYYCEIKCQKLGWKMHKDQCFPVRMQLVGDRGRGMVAVKDIKQGQIVTRDNAIITVEHRTVTDPDHWPSLAEAVGRMSKTEQDKFYSLQPRQGLGLVGGEMLTVQIFLNNGIALADPGYNSEVGIFPSLSFINHSCCPNSKWSQVKGNMEMKEVMALTMIKKGEEITCSYFGDAQEMAFASRNERQQFLESWNFGCSCVLCDLDGEALEEDEIKRKKLREISEEIECEKDKVRKARLCLQKLDMIKVMGVEMLSELSYTYQQTYMAGWSTEEDDWRMKAELVRLDWKRWIQSFPLHSVSLHYSSVVSE